MASVGAATVRFETDVVRAPTTQPVGAQGLPRLREAIFRFLEREFKTRMVRDLKASELMRVRAYVATINRRLAS